MALLGSSRGLRALRIAQRRVLGVGKRQGAVTQSAFVTGGRGAGGKDRGSWGAYAVATTACCAQVVASADDGGESVLDTTTTGVARLAAAAGVGDGRGIVVAVMDTGVDPAAQGLRMTPHGLPKMVDVIDATGAGDVDMATVVEADAAGWLTSPVTGRRLRVDATKWTVDGGGGRRCRNPADGKWRIGAKAAATFWPKAVLDRRAREVKREVEARHRQWIAAARGELAVARRDPISKDVAECEARLAELERAAKALMPTGGSVAPVLDVISWAEPRDDDSGEVVVRTVVVDGAVTSDLTLADAAPKVRPLADFGVSVRLGEPETARWASFGSADLLTYSVSVYSGGAVVALVACSGDHGTHVASIVGGFVEGDAEKCGVAPGCQVVSIKIGDSRLGSMETGAGLARALIAAKRHRVDVVNLSYGEAAKLADAGRFMDRANELVNDVGVVFVASAGNNGPALSTVGAPGGMTRAIIPVGAYVNPNMCQDLYAMRRAPAAAAATMMTMTTKGNGGPTECDGDAGEHGGVVYSFSSRGPSPDGGPGVAIVAPGGAVASVPPYTLQPQRLMHGTSMSSPNAAGSIACLLAALQAHKVPYSPASVRRAIEATARPLPGVDATDQGRGLLAVDEAFNYLKNTHPPRDVDVRFDVSVNERASGSLHPGAPAARGIYLREHFETSDPSEISVSVTPRYQNDAERPNADKAAFSRSVRLESSAPAWVECGDRFILNHGGKAFTVRVDPSKAPLVAGEGPACAEVVGFDADATGSEDVPLFRVPITVVKPIAAAEKACLFTAQPFAAGAIRRTFVAPPVGASNAALTIRAAPAPTAKGDDGALKTDVSMNNNGASRQQQQGLGKRLVHVSTIQLAPQEAYNVEGHTHRRVWVGDGDSVTVELANLSAERTLEVCISQDWNSLEGCELDCDVEFKASGSTCASPVVLRGTRSIAKLDLGAPAWVSAGSTVGSPQAKLKRWRRPLRPTKSTMNLLEDGDRDEWSNGRRYYDLVLEYEWTHPAGVSDGVALRFAGDELVYDAPTDGQHAKITDSRGKVLAWRDARVFGSTKGFHAGAKYTATLTIRHDDTALLDALRDAECWIDMALSKELAAPIFATRQGAYAGDKTSKFREVKLVPGEVRNRCAFLAPPAEADLPKEAAPGDVLMGTVGFARSPSYTAGASRRETQSLVYHVPPRSQKTADKEEKKEKNKKKNGDKPEAISKAKAAALVATAVHPDLAAAMGGAASASADDEKALAKALVALADATFEKQLDLLEKKSALDAATHGAVAAYLASTRPDRTLDVRLAELSFAALSSSSGTGKKNASEESSDAASFSIGDVGTADRVLAAAAALRGALDETAISLREAKRDKDEDLLFDPNATAHDDGDKKDRDREKKALVDALRWTAEAHLAKANATKAAPDLAIFAASIVELEQWVDTKKGSFGDARIRAHLDILYNRPGRALSVLSTWLETKKAKTAPDDDLKAARKLRSELYDQLGWDIWAAAERKKAADEMPHPNLS